MKKVIRYKTNDGKLFKTPTEALAHEEGLKLVTELRESILPKKIDDTNFANGGGYIQLTTTQISKFNMDITKLLKKFHPELVGRPQGEVGRCLNDSGSKLYPLWSLTQQIDRNNRLYGQPYFALNPKEVKGGQIYPPPVSVSFIKSL